MITPTANWLAANASPNKKPVRLVQIAGYGRSFSDHDLGDISGLPYSPIVQTAKQLVDFGGLEDFPSTVTLGKKVTAGDPIFVFGCFGGEQPNSITDSDANSYSLLFNSGPFYAWQATAAVDHPAGMVVILGSVSGGPGFIGGGNFEIFVVEVASAFAGFIAAGNSGSTTPATVTAGATTI